MISKYNNTQYTMTSVICAYNFLNGKEFGELSPVFKSKARKCILYCQNVINTNKPHQCCLGDTYYLESLWSSVPLLSFVTRLSSWSSLTYKKKQEHMLSGFHVHASPWHRHKCFTKVQLTSSIYSAVYSIMLNLLQSPSPIAVAPMFTAILIHPCTPLYHLGVAPPACP